MNDYANNISGITKLTETEPYLRGENVLIAILDSGIDYRNQEFRKENGETRLEGIWDISGDDSVIPPPEGYRVGSYYGRDKINQALQEDEASGYEIVPVYDRSGHGTAVAGIAAGNLCGVAVKSDILVIKLNNQSNALLTTSLMRGIDFAVNYGIKKNMPIAINLSIGNNYGDHQGNSLLERFMDNATEVGKTALVVGSGNEGIGRSHTAGKLEREEVIQLSVSEYEKELLVQLWKNPVDVFSWTIISPGGEMVVLENDRLWEPQIREINLQDTKLLCYLGVSLPYQTNEEFLVQMIAREEGRYLDQGIWNFILTPKDIVLGDYRFYLSGSGARNNRTGFLRPTPDMTLTVPSTAGKVITVGAYDTTLQNYADFSGRGYVYRYEDRTSQQNELMTAAVKPDLVAPGVNITVPMVRGGYEEVSGTSFAAPFVTGMSALLMEWGIVRGNDPYLYAEKLKAFLQENARKLPGQTQYPNSKLGWGALDVKSTFF